jgi:sulfur transfer complex TusBCD TusB component (DsrH family)
VPTYLSSHIIACLTRQALAQLIATLRAGEEVRFVRAGASQMAGRLVCEFEAPDQERLLQFFAAHLVTYEWIIRVELSWSAEEGGASTREGAAGRVVSEAAAAGGAGIAESPHQAPLQGPADAAGAAGPREAVGTQPGAGDARILHILRSLKDESAWQLIATQQQLHPVAVLLMQDAVLAPPPLNVPMYACEADVQARGLPVPLPLLTYDQIIELVFSCQRVTVW